MTEYYRVRTQEQWDWLMAKFDEQNKGIAWPCGQLPSDYNRYYLYQSQTIVYKNDKEILNLSFVTNDPQHENEHSFIEVSDLMEDEKMKDYVKIKDGDLLEFKDEHNRMAFFPDHSDYWHGGFMELFIPKSLLYRKVKMTEAEKVEFDELHRDIYTTLTGTLKYIEEKLENSFLHKRLFHNNDFRLDNKAQIEFARAWSDPSLIEVVKEPRYNVKVPVSKGRDYYEKYNTVKEDNLVIVGELNGGLRELSTNTQFQFTTAELKQYGLDDDMYEKVEVQE